MKDLLAPLIAIALLIAAGIYGVACGAPPPGTDPNSEMAKWFQSLTDKYGSSCCGEADCHQVAWKRSDDGHYMAEYYPGRWIQVPDDTVKARDKEPKGGPVSAVLCWSWMYDSGEFAPGGYTWTAKEPPKPKNVHIYCFTPGYVM